MRYDLGCSTSPNQGCGCLAFVNSPRSLGIPDATNGKPVPLTVAVAVDKLVGVVQESEPRAGAIGRGTPPVPEATSAEEASIDAAHPSQ